MHHQLLHFSIEDMRNDCPVGHLGQNRAFPVIYNILYDLCEPLKILQTMDNVTIIKPSSTWFVFELSQSQKWYNDWSYISVFNDLTLTLIY